MCYNFNNFTGKKKKGKAYHKYMRTLLNKNKELEQHKFIFSDK